MMDSYLPNRVVKQMQRTLVVLTLRLTVVLVCFLGAEVNLFVRLVLARCRPRGRYRHRLQGAGPRGYREHQEGIVSGLF